jgi:hypothetical protein
MGELRLEVQEFRNLAHWRWVLTGPGGRFLDDYEVQLDTGCWQYDAFTDLPGYLCWRCAPDRRIEHEAEIVTEVGKWIAEQVFGPVGATMVRNSPAVVRVVVPEEAAMLAFSPLELAAINDGPIAVQDVTLIMQLGPDNRASFQKLAGKRLRVLGLFSMPNGESPLNLRRERQTLVRVFTEMAAVSRAVEVRVVQYGVTRERLKEVLEEAEGWDIIHISGHGGPGELLLEQENGLPDPISTSDLVGLLTLAWERLKLVSVAACWSAAPPAAEQRRLLGLPVPARRRVGTAGGREEARLPDGSAASALAAEFSSQLGCAVLAMRYPVTDDFAIALAEKLYKLLADKGQPLPRALAMAMREVVADPPTPARPALSVATPTLFGARAADLNLVAPERTRPEAYNTELLKLATFPPQPERFVGRSGIMARASAALAPQSGAPGVLLYGMPGGGKSACALELAYTHERVFDRMVWFKAPDEGQDIADALTRFALTLEAGLPGLQMVHVLEDSDALAAFMPQLTEMCERRRVLIVVDNIESLLSRSGQWRDARWGRVVAALSDHAGLGRLVLTSRRMPTDADPRARIEVVDALTLDEALLLARELPHLCRLIDGTLAGVDPQLTKGLALGVLNVAQGHPKLLELADGQAAVPGQLPRLIDAASQAWDDVGGLPDGFFAMGETQAATEDYRHVLETWTRVVVDGLAAGEKDLLGFLCCLEESDRTRAVAQDSWPPLWHRLGQAGDAPSLPAAMESLSARGLVSIWPGDEKNSESYGIHPGVAVAARAQAGQEFRAATDTELAEAWSRIALRAHERDVGQEVVRAGLRAAPYLLRIGRWQEAGYLLKNVFSHDQSRPTMGAMLPALKVIAKDASGTEFEAYVDNMFCIALSVVGATAEGDEDRSLEELAAALNRQDYSRALIAATNLAMHYRWSRRLPEALQFAKQATSYAERAETGPWSMLLGEVVRLDVLTAMGQTDQVGAEFPGLWAHMESLSVKSDQQEFTHPGYVRDMFLRVAYTSAMQLERWPEALELSTLVIASMRSRSAPEDAIATARMNTYKPLAVLGHLDEAFEMLVECREIFKRTGDIRALGVVLGALAEVEARRGHGPNAISLETDALRYIYIAGDVDNIQISHNNLGSHLRDQAGELSLAIAHHLAAALIQNLTGRAGLQNSIRAAANDFRMADNDAKVPATVTELCQQVNEVPGVHLDQLLIQLQTGPQAAQLALDKVISRARAVATQKSSPS